MKLYGGDGLVFIGNSACGVTDLTLDQVRAIFRGEITNWSELGGRGSRDPRALPRRSVRQPAAF